MGHKKYIVNSLIVVFDYGATTYTSKYRYPGDIITEKQYNDLDEMYKECCSVYKKAPKAPKLYNVELHHWNKKTQTDHVVETVMWNSPMALCKWKIKCLENANFVTSDQGMSLMLMPKATYFGEHPDNGFYWIPVRADKSKKNDKRQSTEGDSGTRDKGN